MGIYIPQGRLLDPSEVSLFQETEVKQIGFNGQAAKKEVTIQTLLTDYARTRATLEKHHRFLMSTRALSVMQLFGWYNQAGVNFSNTFSLSGAVAGLNAEYWQKAFDLTKVLPLMPTDLRSEWLADIKNKTAPDFIPASVIPTIEDLLLGADSFFAQRIDGVFKGLSGKHVSNSPSGFKQRFIIADVYSKKNDSVSSEKSERLTDLRMILAKFLGRDYTKTPMNSHYIIMHAIRKHRGEWVSVDGGVLRLRMYAVGTAHIEVHPELAWRMNAMLAKLYPMALPQESRTRPNTVEKNFPLYERPLDARVTSVLRELRCAREFIDGRFQNNIPNSVSVYHYSLNDNKALSAEVFRVLFAIGGVPGRSSKFDVLFDYNPFPVLEEIAVSGVLPDDKTYQYYPTEEFLATYAADLADIQDDDECCEPSAGLGGLAQYMPKDRTLCIEICALRAQVLKARGYAVLDDDAVAGDFLRFQAQTRFDVIMMNPPFSQERWRLHVQHAMPMLKPGGRLVAIVPNGSLHKLDISGFTLETFGPFQGQFSGTNVSVQIIRLTKSVELAK